MQLYVTRTQRYPLLHCPHFIITLEPKATRSQSHGPAVSTEETMLFIQTSEIAPKLLINVLSSGCRR